MTRAFLVLSLVASITLLGDYFLKMASGKSEGILSVWFAGGALMYGLAAFGWFFLMKSNSLATIGVMFSASTILLLAGLGYFVFKEQFGLREIIGVSLAVLAVAVMSPR